MGTIPWIGWTSRFLEQIFGRGTSASLPICRCCCILGCFYKKYSTQILSSVLLISVFLAGPFVPLLTEHSTPGGEVDHRSNHHFVKFEQRWQTVSHWIFWCSGDGETACHKGHDGPPEVQPPVQLGTQWSTWEERRIQCCIRWLPRKWSIQCPCGNVFGIHRYKC